MWRRAVRRFLLMMMGALLPWPVLAEDLPCDQPLVVSAAVADLEFDFTGESSLQIQTAEVLLDIRGTMRPASGEPSGAVSLPSPIAYRWGRPSRDPLIAQFLDQLLLYDPLSNNTLGDLRERLAQNKRQTDPTEATNEARQLGPLSLSKAEADRLKSSAACQDALVSLKTTFESHRKKMHFWADPGRTVADFVTWYFQSDLPQADREKAAPVLRAQERFGVACMEKKIPPELNPSLVQRAVGLLMFGDKVFCTALRVSANEILTARHCFFDANAGTPSKDLVAVLNGTRQMWFVYEAEPSKRFGLCRESLPKATGTAVSPVDDNARVRIRTTSAPLAPLRWAESPMKLGSSLYLRGYFPFAANETTVLGRLRSTAAGGCVAHSGSGRCFFHACQTTPIMSGAPVFVRPEPNAPRDYLEVAGIHLGSALLADPAGPNGSVCAGINGARVPSSNFAYQPQP